MTKKNRKEKQNDEEYIPKAFRKETNKKNNNEQFKIKDRKRMKKKNKKMKVLKVVLPLILLIILIFGISTAINANKWKTIAGYMMQNQNSIVKDSKGNTIANIGSEKYKSNLTLEQMPKNLKNAYVAIEDERYYKHGGIDVKRTGGAIVSYIFHFGSSSYGGSTITQQLVKNTTGDSSGKISRKVKEWWKAIVLDNSYSKDEILEAYLNIIYVGPNIYGVDAGAKYYFSKSAQELSLEECAFLAGINNSPNSYNPFSENDSNEKINKRTKTVLSKMKELGYITEDELNNANSNVDSGLKFKKGNIETSKEIYSYHTDALITEVIKDLEDKYNISETFANNLLQMGGLTITSTQDSKIQDESEKEVSKAKYVLKSDNGKDTSQTAVVIINQKTGQVLACIGGLGTKKESRTLNRATQSIRQTGSAMKPIAVLGPALSKKIITNATIVDDTEQDFGEDHYHPTDYNKALGKVTVRRAVESSQNIPFVTIMQKLGTKTSINYLKKMGITSLTKKDDTLPLALGGLDKGVSPLQMAGAYATIANEGVYIEPTFYEKVEKNSKTVVKSKQNKRRVFSKETASVLQQLLRQPVEGAKGTATYCKISGVDVAAKTGTTDENYDRWLCGFTPYYTAVAWYGFDQNETIHFGGKNPAGLIWANVMSRVHTGLQSAKFNVPTSVKSCEICSDTGMRATTACQNTYTEYFINGTIPSLCTTHKGAELKKNTDTQKDVKNTIQNIIEGITQDIDALDPQEIDRVDSNTTTNTTNEKTNTTTTTNSTKSTNTVENTTSNNIIRNTISENTNNTSQNSATTNAVNNTNNNSTSSSNTSEQSSDEEE